MARLWIIIAGLLGAGAVALGAYHAHGLEKFLEKRGLEPAEIAERMDNADVAIKYQMYHALAILGVGILIARQRGACGGWMLNIAAAAMLLGIAGFGGGLYAIVFNIADLHWSVVPGGGVLMIVGWLSLALGGFCIAGDESSAAMK